MTVIDKLKELGYKTIPEDFYDKVGEWKSWYIGNVKGFHDYKVRNSGKTILCRRYSLGMGKKLPEDWANLLMNEKVKITLEGKKEQEFVDNIFTDNNFWIKANEMQEMKAALGTVAYIPRVIGQKMSNDGIVVGEAESIALDYVTVEHIYPLAWHNGCITECAFDSIVTVDGENYLYLQIHTKGLDGNYDILNKTYRYSNENLSEISLTEVKGFEKIPPVVHTQSTKRQFIIDRMNIANNYDYSLPMGIPVYANAIDVLKGVDIAYDSYVNEFVLGKKRIMVQPAAATFVGGEQDGEPIFDANDVVFYVLPEDIKDGNVVVPIDMTLRTQEHNTGIQDQLNILSSKCGFGENHYRFSSGSIQTATQVVSENSTLFRTIKKHEIILEAVLIELCRTILRLGNMAMKAGLNEEVEISIDFDDSIIEDKSADFQRDMQLLNAGILNDWEFRAKWMNEDEATAKAALPRMEDMTGTTQEEVE